MSLEMFASVNVRLLFFLFSPIMLFGIIFCFYDILCLSFAFNTCLFSSIWYLCILYDTTMYTFTFTLVISCLF